MDYNINKKSCLTQNVQILAHLLKGNSITSLQSVALFDCVCLPKRISELRKKGVNIKSKWITTNSGKRVLKYYIEQLE